MKQPIFKKNKQLTVLEAGKSKVKVPAWSPSGESPFLFHSQRLLAMSSHNGKGSEANIFIINFLIMCDF